MVALHTPSDHSINPVSYHWPRLCPFSRTLGSFGDLASSSLCKGSKSLYLHVTSVKLGPPTPALVAVAIALLSFFSPDHRSNDARRDRRENKRTREHAGKGSVVFSLLHGPIIYESLPLESFIFTLCTFRVCFLFLNLIVTLYTNHFILRLLSLGFLEHLCTSIV